MPLFWNIEKKTWDFDREVLRKALSNPKVKLFILNSPHNPTGKVFTKEEIEEIQVKGQLKSQQKLEAHHPDHTQKLTDTIHKNIKSTRGRGNVQESGAAKHGGEDLDKQQRKALKRKQAR